MSFTHHCNSLMCSLFLCPLTFVYWGYKLIQWWPGEVYVFTDWLTLCHSLLITLLCRSNAQKHVFVNVNSLANVMNVWMPTTRIWTIKESPVDSCCCLKTVRTYQLSVQQWRLACRGLRFHRRHQRFWLHDLESRWSHFKQVAMAKTVK